jgi:hypothetical protein
MTSLNLASNNLRAAGGKIVAEAIKVTKCTPAIILVPFSYHLTFQSTAVVCYYPQDMRALSSLNLADNSLGLLDLPEGWEEEDGIFYGPDDEEQDDPPPGFSPAGIIAVANAIKDMRAMTSLNLASNDLSADGAKIVVEAIKVTKCTPAIILAPFSCPADFSINCCCLLLSAGYEGADEPESFRQ